MQHKTGVKNLKYTRVLRESYHRNKFKSRHSCKMGGKFSPPKEIIFWKFEQELVQMKKEFGFYLTAMEANSKPDAVQTSRLLTALSEIGCKVCNQL